MTAEELKLELNYLVKYAESAHRDLKCNWIKGHRQWVVVWTFVVNDDEKDESLEKGGEEQ